MADYYKILGIMQWASSAEIRKAYCKLALIWHPDKNPEITEAATKMFIDISTAYKILIDESRRKIYDCTLYQEIPYAQNSCRNDRNSQNNTFNGQRNSNKFNAGNQPNTGRKQNANTQYNANPQYNAGTTYNAANHNNKNQNNGNNRRGMPNNSYYEEPEEESDYSSDYSSEYTNIQDEDSGEYGGRDYYYRNRGRGYRGGRGYFNNNRGYYDRGYWNSRFHNQMDYDDGSYNRAYYYRGPGFRGKVIKKTWGRRGITVNRHIVFNYYF